MTCPDNQGSLFLRENPFPPLPFHPLFLTWIHQRMRERERLNCVESKKRWKRSEKRKFKKGGGKEKFRKRKKLSPALMFVFLIFNSSSFLFFLFLPSLFFSNLFLNICSYISACLVWGTQIEKRTREEGKNCDVREELVRVLVWLSITRRAFKRKKERERERESRKFERRREERKRDGKIVINLILIG